jgi:hypothetical protein
VVINGQEYHFRTIQGDIWRLATNPSQFIIDRANPLTIKTPAEWVTGRNWRGEKVDTLEMFREFLKAASPIPLKGWATDPGETTAHQVLRAFFASTGIQEKRYVSRAESKAHEFAKQNPARKMVVSEVQSPLFKEYLYAAVQNRLDENKADKALAKGKITSGEYKALKRLNKGVAIVNDWRWLDDEQREKVYGKMSAKERLSVPVPDAVAEKIAPEDFKALSVDEALHTFESFSPEKQKEMRLPLWNRLKEIQKEPDADKKKQMSDQFWQLVRTTSGGK